ncbi:chemotaxis protein CheC [Haloarculaceae archaeon H-GB2-1]|nr:chemotaxis protein CheC [Haloarculaceae archaeon H-GB1-1]MEA5387400.1 chemotaxis protein CheC [Haloarculaceae archaeon H-GB11]MEA5408873.1 chemotaxis protein CheC [Haloarculaceae archaeon H-GB2-1]
MPILIDIRKLTLINRLIHDGAGNVAEALSTMAGVDANVEIKSISFVDPQDIPSEMGTGDLFAASIKLTEPPYGVFLMTFSQSTGAEIAELMTGQPVETEFNQMHESALQEICNITTSGFIDGIANTLKTTIEMRTPKLELATGEEISEETLTHIRMDALSIVLDSVVDIKDSDSEFQIRIFLVPDPGSFVNLVDKIDLSAVEAQQGDDRSTADKFADSS